MTVQGESVCPRPDEVARALDPLLSSGDRVAVHGRAELVPDGPSVRLRLLRPDGTLLSEKQLSAQPSCADMAETVAVVLAAWVAQLQVDLPYAFEMPHRTDKQVDAEQPVVAAELLRAPAPAVRSWNGTVGTGVFASFQAATFAPALTIDARARRADSSWGGKRSRYLGAVPNIVPRRTPASGSRAHSCGSTPRLGRPCCGPAPTRRRCGSWPGPTCARVAGSARGVARIGQSLRRGGG